MQYSFSDQAKREASVDKLNWVGGSSLLVLYAIAA